MTFTYDPEGAATDLSRVRLRIGDTASPGLFADEELDSLIADGGARWRRGLASALLAMAVSDVWNLKVMTRGDLQTDGAKSSAELRQLAKALIEEDDILITGETIEGDWDIAEMVFDDFGFREQVRSRALRGVL